MKIAIGADHRGYKLKEFLKQNSAEISWIDLGTDHETPASDYPDFAQKVCQKVLGDNDCHAGILICGSGVGMSIASNRFLGIYAGLCWSPEVALAAKKDDCINILILPADFITEINAMKTLQAWQKEHCLLDHHADRRNLIDRITSQ